MVAQNWRYKIILVDYTVENTDNVGGLKYNVFPDKIYKVVPDDRPFVEKPKPKPVHWWAE